MMALFKNYIRDAASQLDVPLTNADFSEDVFFVEGFVIKAMNKKLRISGWVWLVGHRSMEVLFETGSMDYAQKALHRVMLVSREISRIKSFDLFKNDPRVKIQIECSHHDTYAGTNFIAENSGAIWFSHCDRVDISARYHVPCENDGSEWHFLIHKELYMQKRLEESKHWPGESAFTEKRKYAITDFANGTLVENLQSLYMLGLPYRIVAIRVDRVEQFDEDAQDVFKAYDIPLPPEKVQVQYIAVKVANTPPQVTHDNYVIAS